MGLFQSPQEQFFQFREASKRFRMIEEVGQPVIIPWQRQGKELVERLRRGEQSRALRRQLQRYTVSVYEDLHIQMLGVGDLEEVHEGCTVLSNMDCYDTELGFRVDRPGYREPAALIV